MKSERGALMVEYGLILFLVVSVCIAAIIQVGAKTLALFDSMPAGL